MSSPVLAVVPLGMPWQTLDPFLFCVHHLDAYPAGNAVQGPVESLAGRQLGSDFAGIDGWNMYHGEVVPGFPAHPHRGFETITVVRSGHVDHSDSLGATARYGPGDVQWMTAGAGIVHAEMFPLREAAQDNPLELFQIWLNLPRADKMVTPYFTMFWDDQVPREVVRDAEGRATHVDVIAGALGDARPPSPPPSSWASRAESDIAIWVLSLEPHARFTLPPARFGTHRVAYLFSGVGASVGDRALLPGHGAQLTPDVPVELKNGPGKSELLVLQGRPIGEPVARHGPFVMNTEAEIRQAYADYQRTRFGGWPWDGTDPVHPRGKGRFAKHADGRIEDIG